MTRRSTAWVIPIFLASAALAQPAPSPTYDEAMKQGNALVAKKDAAGAMKAFQAALAAKPGDARALSELSVAALVAGDLAVARDAAERSIGIAMDAGDIKVAAASYYNLGRAKEAAGDVEGARRAYSSSLSQRENKETRARWGKLGGGDPFLAHTLVGPFAKPEAFCAKEETCSANPVDVREGKKEIGAPFSEIMRIKSNQRESETLFWLSLGLHLPDGWYVLPAIGELANRSEFEITDVRMVGSRLVIRYDATSGRFDWDETAGTFVCGLGASRKPSCVGPIQTYIAHNEHRGGKESTDDTLTISVSCQADLLAGDVLQVGRSSKKLPKPESDGEVIVPPRPDACDSLKIFGKHKLAF
jgi:hypothetical protein